MANLKRSNTISFTNGSYVSPGNGYFVNVYAPGAICKSASGSGTTTVQVYDGSVFVTGEYAMVGIDTTKVYRVNTGTAGASGSQTIILDGSVSGNITNGTVLVNLGVDTGAGAAPTYIQNVTPNSPIYLYPDTSTPIANSKVTCDANGDYSYYYPAANNIWELVRNTAGTPLQVFINNSQVTLTSNGTIVANSIARWIGATGTLLGGGYADHAPIIDDHGVITASNTGQTLGGLIVTAGATIGTTLAVAGNTTLGDANSDATTINGSATVTNGLTVSGGTTSLQVTTATNLTATGTTTLVDTVTRRLKPSAGTHLVNNDFGSPFSGIAGGWGSGSSISIQANSTTQRWTVTITAGGSSKTTNPTFTLGNTVFPDDTFTTQPFCLVQQTGGITAGNPSTHAHLDLNITATQLTVKWLSTAPADGTYIFTGLILG